MLSIMKKLILLFTLVVFVGLIAAPVFASADNSRIVMVRNDDDPKKNKEKKEDTDKKENTDKKVSKEATDSKEDKDCKKECPQTCKPSDCEHHQKVEEKK